MASKFVKESRVNKSRNRNQKRQQQEAQSETLTTNLNGTGTQSTKFFGCYLLTSLSPRYKGHSYIGFTVNPRRRIRQHNGEITSGASKTKKKRPWEMILCIHGFPTHVSALQFEWAWQHPKESLVVRQTAATFKTLGGLSSKIKLALTMLTLPSWNSMELTVSFFSTTYMKHTAGCPTLPHLMKIHFCSMDDLPCYNLHAHDHIHSHSSEDFGDDGDEDDAHQLHLQNGFVEINCSSSDLQNSTIQDANEEDRLTLEKQMHVLHHDDVHGLAGTSIASQIPINEQIWSKGPTDSFTILEEDDVVYISSIDETSSKEQSQPPDKKSPNRVAEMVRSSSSMAGVEVIDLFTPSPDCRISTGNKRRRIVSDSSDIIDLTRSPLFVQL